MNGHTPHPVLVLFCSLAAAVRIILSNQNHFFCVSFGLYLQLLLLLRVLLGVFVFFLLWLVLYFFYGFFVLLLLLKTVIPDTANTYTGSYENRHTPIYIFTNIYVLFVELIVSIGLFVVLRCGLLLSFR